MWEKIKLINSQIFAFVLPFLRQMMSAAGPILAAAAVQAVQAIAANTGSTATGAEKRDAAFSAIAANLEKQGVKVGTDVAVSMVNAAIELAVAQVKS